MDASVIINENRESAVKIQREISGGGTETSFRLVEVLRFEMLNMEHNLGVLTDAKMDLVD